MVNGQLINGLQITNSIETSNSGITVCSWEVPQDTFARVEVTCLFQQQVNSDVNTSYKIATNVMRQDGYASLVGDSIKFDEEGSTGGFEVIFDADENSISVITASADGYSYKVSCFMNIYSVEQFIDGYSLLFDGVDEYVTMGDVLGFERTDAFSWSGWVKTTDISGGLFGKYGGSPLGYLLTVGDGALSFYMVKTWATDNFNAFAFCSINDGNWHHVVLTYSGNGSSTGVKFYFDKVLLTNETPDFNNLVSSIQNTADLRLGVTMNSTPVYLACNLDEISIYNKELLLTEVQAIYDSGSPNNIKNLSSASNLVGYWRCGDGDTYPTIQDYSSDYQFPTIPDETINGYNGTAINMEVSDIQFDTPGSQALVFDGVNEYVTMGNVLGFERTNAFSVSVWFKATVVGWDTMVSKREGSGDYRGWAVLIDLSGYLRFDLCNSNETNHLAVGTTGTVIDGLWHHAVCCYDGSSSGSGMTLWLDGVDQTGSIQINNLTGTVLNASPMALACINGTGNMFPGSLDEVSVWNKELSAAEVSETYNNKVPINLTTISCASDLAAWWRCGERFSLATDGVPDFSGNGLHGTQQNMEITDVEDRTHMGSSMVFGGTDEKIDFGDVLDFDYDDAFSISFWARWTIATAMPIIAKRNSTTGYQIFASSLGWIQLEFINTYATNKLSLESDNAYNNGIWHHCVFTLDGSGTAAGVALYVDGVAVATSTISDTLSATTINDGNLNFGTRYQEDYWYQGDLDEVSFWDKELSVSEVEAIYNAGIPTDLAGSSNLVGYWKMGDGVGFNGTMTNMEEADIVRDVPH